MPDEGDDRPVPTTLEETAGVEQFDRRFEWSPAGRPASVVAYLLGALPYAVGGVLAVAVAVLLVSNAAALADADGVPDLPDPDELNPLEGDDGDAPDGTPTAAATVPPTPSPGTATPTAGRTPTAGPPPTDSPTATDTPTAGTTATTDPTATATNVTATPGNDTLTETAVPTATPAPTDTPAPAPTPSSTPTATPAPTDTPAPTATASPTPTPRPSPSPSPTPTTTATATEAPIITVGSARTRSGAPMQLLWLVLFALSVGVLVRRRRS